MACVFNCGNEKPSGDRAVAVQTDGVKRWQCHEYGCGRNGNLVGMCDLLKPGDHCNGKPRGQRFKDIAADLQAMAGGAPPPAQLARASSQPSTPPPPAEPKVTAPPTQTDQPERNVPLKHAENPRARGLVNLDEKFLIQPDEAMNPHAAAYISERPYLTPDVMQKWRCGYLPKDTGGDKTGGTMRGKFVYALHSEVGEVLTWFGRNLQFEQERRQWVQSGRPANKGPTKSRFVKGFHRGLELYGQQAGRLDEPGYRDAIAELGIIVVEGPNDVIALDTLQVSVPCD